MVKLNKAGVTKMKKLLAITALITLTGCASIIDMIPSRWDVNQAKVVTDIQQGAKRFDCKGDQLAQLTALDRDIEWFDIYAKTKPTRDVAKLTKTMVDTVNEFKDRASKGPVSPLYCELKKKIIIQQSEIIAGAVQGRF
jgi:PBP1b-binding outer membrane lipoprotein LpoB